MTQPRIPEPQELAFGALFMWLLVRLALAGHAGSASFAIFASLLVAMLALAAWCRANPSPWRWLVRRWFVVPAMLIGYFALGGTVPLVSQTRADWLQAADLKIFGGHAAMEWQSITWPWLTEIMSAAYLLFYPSIAYGLWVHARRTGTGATQFLRANGVLWALGFFGYVLLPAAGPYLEMPGRFSVPLDGWFFAPFASSIAWWGSNRVDCFPSLHCAISGALLVFEFQRSRLAGWLLTPVVAALWFSTLYLRQHYAVDVLAAAALIAVVCPLVARWPDYSPGNLGRSK